MDSVDAKSGSLFVSHGNAIGIYGLLSLLALSPALIWLLLGFKWLVTIGIISLGILFWRHIQIQYRRASTKQALVSTMSGRSADLDQLPAVYFLYVLGSGGHTTEMMETIKAMFKGDKNQHRRYIVDVGEQHSRGNILRIEDSITSAYGGGDKAGTWDIYELPRARRVHQSYLTSIFSTLRSALYIVSALTVEPSMRTTANFGNGFKYPHVIVTNGPGTGFIVGVISHMLQILGFAPGNRLRVVYIETWAHITSLSLTGKLFHWSGLADLYLVQHMPLAEKYNKTYIRIFN